MNRDEIQNFIKEILRLNNIKKWIEEFKATSSWRCWIDSWCDNLNRQVEAQMELAVSDFVYARMKKEKEDAEKEEE